MPSDQFQQQPIGRQVAFIRHFPADLHVLEIVEIVALRIKNCKRSQPVRLVNLKIKANCGHDIL
jgi:hypothetical protein